jgi:hypothetical protein
MGLLASVVVSTLPLLGGVQLDADAQGRGVLAWDALRGRQFVVRTVDVVDGRPRGRVRELWRTPGGVGLGQVDVAPSGAAVVCFAERRRRLDETWRVRVARRLPGRRWTRPALVDVPAGYAENVGCGIGDAGDAVVAWSEHAAGPGAAVFIAADGTVEAPLRLPAGVDPPQVAVAPDASAVVAFTDKPRTLHAAVRPPGGPWSVRAVTSTPVYLPRLAEDGTLGWNDDTSPRLASGPLTMTPASTLAALASSPRGDTLATWFTHPSPNPRAPSSLRAAVRRPGGAFSAPFKLGRLTTYPLATALAADGSGAVAWGTGSRRRPRLVARVLGADGRWSVQRTLASFPGEADLAAAPGGRATVAWTAKPGRRETLRVGLLTGDGGRSPRP